MTHDLSTAILPAAFMLDLILGDPRWLPHPVRWMGAAVQRGERLFRSVPLRLRISGGLMAVSLIAAVWVLSATAVRLARGIGPEAETVLQVVLIYYALSAHSLAAAALSVYRALAAGDLTSARRRVSMIVGRDTQTLNPPGVARAAVETVAENLVDGVLAPLFFAFLGGAPLAMAYKMVNTLDSMIGYRNPVYEKFGTVAARIDDAANYVPARLAIPIIALAAQILGGTGARALGTALGEGSRHASPNSGRPEAGFAGALGVRLGGPAVYEGRQIEKPVIGDGFPDPVPGDIPKACDLMTLSALIGVAVCWMAGLAG